MEVSVDEDGIVVFETVMWLMMVLPLIIMGSVVAMTAHNRNALRVIPEALLQEQMVPGLRLEGGVSGVSWVANTEALVDRLSELLDTAIERARTSTLQASAISAKGCVSVFIVDGNSGRIVGEVERRCDARGPSADQLDIERPLNAYHGQLLGIPVPERGATSQYISRLVVVGLSVGAEMAEVAGSFGERYLAYGATAVPRQEVVL